MERLIETARGFEDDMVAFAQKLIQTPSISGEEGAVAQLICAEMEKLGYDEVYTDDIGNTVGLIRGAGDGPTVNYNSHMDHVDPGDPANWEYEPYGATIAGGHIHGRAASDVKGGLASQVYAGAVLAKSGLPFRGTYMFTGVVQEEPAECFGMQYLVDETLPSKGQMFDVMITSEATSLNLYLGHRGRLEMEVTTYGRTSHGSAPQLGINAITKMMPILAAVDRMAADLPRHAFLGQSSIAPTIINCSPGRLSIIPDRCTVSLDRRFLPEEKIEDVLGQIDAIVASLSKDDPELKAAVAIREAEETSYRGYTRVMRKLMAPFMTPQESAEVQACVRGLRAIGQSPSYGTWYFNTDASYVSGDKGIPTIGYSPGEEHYAHTPKDRISLDLLLGSLPGNAAIAAAFLGI
ncbi:MAG: YgeY family selenium metabolism-linked hydrolase [Thermoleophilia bacterium]|nr:YgeY family selenium metabolism-linked hydrolase [Thermoleophilia bacterium]